MIVSGNRNKDLAYALSKIYPDAVYCSRETGYELTNSKDRDRFAQEAVNHDVIILCSALWQFEQTVLLDAVHKACLKQDKQAHIVCVGSTTDRTSKGTTWLYNAEKKALRDYCNSLALLGVWHSGPKVSYISFGTLSNNQSKHPDRKCLHIDEAAQYIKWLIDQPKHVNINEISIDPMQDGKWYE
jgi:short-subunit dehydrogenase